MKKYMNYKSMLDVQRGAESKSRFSNYDGGMSGGMGDMNSLNRTLTVRVTNATNASATYVIFGGTVFGFDAAAGSGTGVTVEVLESSHMQAKIDFGNAPIYITGMKLRTTDEAQFDELITVANKSTSGHFQSWVAQPTNWDSPMNQNPKLLVADPALWSWAVNGITYITGSIRSGVTLTFTITVGARMNMGALYEGKPPVYTSNAPFPSGQLPTIIKTADNSAVGAMIPMVAKGK